MLTYNYKSVIIIVYKISVKGRNMKYCIYLRKSRADLEAEVRGEGETLVRHERALIDLSKKLDLHIEEIYREIVSGETIASRPIMQQLLSEVEQGLWDGVLVMEIERLARGDTVDQGIMTQTFKYSNTKIITPMKTYDPNNEFDEEYFEFGLFMSRREYKTINRRLQTGRMASVKEGKYLGNTPPYGYIRTKLENDKGYTLQQHPDQKDIIKLIYDLYTLGELQSNGTRNRLGTGLIARKLNEMKIPPQKGDVWTTSTIRGILTNPVYIGKIRWNWRRQVKKIVDGQMVKERPRNEDYMLVDGLHEAIIDDKTWKVAQKFMSKNNSRPLARNKSIKNPLSGLIVCGKCGRKMIRRPYKSNYPDTLMCRLPSCGNISSQLNYVEERTLQALEYWLHKYKIQWETENKNQESTIQHDVKKDALKKLDKELETLQTQMNNLHDLLEQGIYSTDTFLERSKILNEKLAETQRIKKTLQGDLASELKREKYSKTIVPKIERVLEVYHTVETAAEKNALLKEVVEKVIYTKKTNGRWHNNPDKFEIALHPKLPK